MAGPVEYSAYTAGSIAVTLGLIEVIKMFVHGRSATNGNGNGAKQLIEINREAKVERIITTLDTMSGTLSSINQQLHERTFCPYDTRVPK